LTSLEGNASHATSRPHRPFRRRRQARATGRRPITSTPARRAWRFAWPTGGRKTWTFHFTSPTDGKRSRLSLGTYPATSLASARTKALEAKGHVEAGNDPRAVIAAQGAAAMTVAGLVAPISPSTSSRAFAPPLPSSGG
jgi:hypothetical protein